MDNENLHSQSDDLFKKEFEKLAEEHPSDKEWSAMREKLVDEGLLTPESKRRRFLPFFIAALVLIPASIWFFSNDWRLVTKNNVVENNSISPKKDEVKVKQDNTNAK